MRMPFRSLLLCGFLVSLFVGGCSATPKIPGTDIPDNDETRAILRVLERYRTSFVQRDASGVLATAHPTYYDASGTDDPGDDIEYQDLGPMLRERFAQIDSIRFTIDYLEITIDNDRAAVKVWLDASFRLNPITDPQSGQIRVESQHSRKQDHAMFELIRDEGNWRITMGM